MALKRPTRKSLEGIRILLFLSYLTHRQQIAIAVDVNNFPRPRCLRKRGIQSTRLVLFSQARPLVRSAPGYLYSFFTVAVGTFLFDGLCMVGKFWIWTASDPPLSETLSDPPRTNPLTTVLPGYTSQYSWCLFSSRLFFYRRIT